MMAIQNLGELRNPEWTGAKTALAREEYGGAKELGFTICLTERFIALCRFHILAASNLISEWVVTFDRGHSWWLYSAAPMGDQTVATRNWYPTQ